MKKAALLVIDFINDIVNPEGKLQSCVDYCEKYPVFERANQAITFAKQQDIPVIFVKVGFSKNYIECPKNSPLFSTAPKYQALELNSWGTDFDKRIDADAADTVLTKHRASCFYNTALETVLRANQIDTLLLAGVSTEMAVLTTVREAHDRDYQVIVLEDACAGRELDTHQAAITLINPVADVCKVEQLPSLLLSVDA